MYDAYYYCYECHENEESVIPSKILYNWDFTKYKGTSGGEEVTWEM